MNGKGARAVSGSDASIADSSGRHRMPPRFALASPQMAHDSELGPIGLSGAVFIPLQLDLTSSHYGSIH